MRKPPVSYIILVLDHIASGIHSPGLLSQVHARRFCHPAGEYEGTLFKYGNPTWVQELAFLSRAD